MRNLFLVFALIMVAVPPALAQSTVGAAPGFRDLGTIERGESRQVTFYITSDASDTFELSAGFDPPLYSRVFDGTNIEDRYSREPIESWIDFNQESYVINPNDTNTVRLQNGAPVTSQGRVTFEIDVPTDAEPGYRAGAVSLSPAASESGNVVGASNIGIARPSFSFRVPGSVERDIDLQGLRALRTGSNSAQIVAEFQNTGTVTTRLDSVSASVVNEAGQRVGNVSFGVEIIDPGDLTRLETNWRGEDVDGGEYSLEGSANYITGNAYIGGGEADFVLTDQIRQRVEIEDPESDGGDEEEQGDSSTVLVLIFLAFLGALLYSFDFDPFYIVVGVCTAGLVLLVLSTGIPSLLIAPLLIISGALVYYA
jgi:hypothetical protein